MERFELHSLISSGNEFFISILYTLILNICKQILFGSINYFHHFWIFFWLHFAACGTLVLQAGTEPLPHALEAQSLNHWTAREVLIFFFSFLYLSFNFLSCMN